jgi:hypothetical protein
MISSRDHARPYLAVSIAAYSSRTERARARISSKSMPAILTHKRRPDDGRDGSLVARAPGVRLPVLPAAAALALPRAFG